MTDDGINIARALLVHINLGQEYAVTYLISIIRVGKMTINTVAEMSV